MNGTTVHDCCEDHITPLHDQLPPDATTSRQSPIRSNDIKLCQPIHDHVPSSPPTCHAAPFIKQETSSGHEHMTHNHDTSSWPQINRTTRRQLAQNEFEYPVDSLPLSVNQTTLIKHAKKWTFDIQNAL